MDEVNPRPAYTIDGFCEAFGVGRSTACAGTRRSG